MKVLFVALVLSSSVLAEVKCKVVYEKEFNDIRDNLVMEGKGVRELNEILQARLQICRNKCTGAGLCIAVKE